HALRLLELPKAVLEWVRVLLSVLLKYRRLTGLGELAEELLALARQLRALQALLQDGRLARCLVVTRAAELPRKETVRLLGALGRLGLSVPAVLVNARVPPGCPRCAGMARAEANELEILRRRVRSAILVAPALAPPPRGAHALLRFGETWGWS